MNYNVKTAEEFFSALEDDWRKEKLLEVRDMILSIDNNIEEDIEYKMLAIKRNGKTLMCLNAQKNYVSLYSYFGKFDYDESILEPFNVGKGCVRIKKSISLKDTRLKEFIEILMS